jgi:hypothetical protein
MIPPTDGCMVLSRVLNFAGDLSVEVGEELLERCAVDDLELQSGAERWKLQSLLVFRYQRKRPLAEERGYPLLEVA